MGILKPFSYVRTLSCVSCASRVPCVFAGSEGLPPAPEVIPTPETAGVVAAESGSGNNSTAGFADVSQQEEGEEEGSVQMLEGAEEEGGAGESGEGGWAWGAAAAEAEAGADGEAGQEGLPAEEAEQPAYTAPATIDGQQELPAEVEQPAEFASEPDGEHEQELSPETEQPVYAVPGPVDGEGEGEDGSGRVGGVGELGVGDGDRDGESGWDWPDQEKAQDKPQDQDQDGRGDVDGGGLEDQGAAGEVTFQDAPQSGSGYGQGYGQETGTGGNEGGVEGEEEEFGQGTAWPLEDGSHQAAPEPESPAAEAADIDIASASSSGSGSGGGGGKSVQSSGGQWGLPAAPGTSEGEAKYGGDGEGQEQWQVHNISETAGGDASGGLQEQPLEGGYDKRVEDADGDVDGRAEKNYGSGGDFEQAAEGQAGDNNNNNNNGNSNACASREDCGGDHWTCSMGVCDCRFPFAGASCLENVCGQLPSCDACREANNRATGGRGAEDGRGCVWGDGVCTVSAGPLYLEPLPLVCPEAAAEAAAVAPSAGEPQPALPQLWYGAGLPLVFLLICGGLLLFVAKCVRKWCRGSSDGPNYTP